MPGEVAILNVAAGDTKLTFDSKDAAEREKAARIVKDMIRRGFVLLIEVGKDEKGPLYRRATDFDDSTNEYIVAGSADDQEQTHDQEPAGQTRTRSQGSRRKPAARRVPAAATNAVAVARTAGG